ncbi:arginine--tRNA ligase [Ascidiimonas aurantiaca]|uniref:arginine--tRNA ligase n=1 Tax=Ascidiimonas aurantiaca TaxID=1685432 RepID=UPI0030EF89BA
MNIQQILESSVKEAVQKLWNASLESVEFQGTRKDFEGDITVVVFPMLRVLKGNPQKIGETLGEYLVTHVDEVARFNVVKGFLNLVLADSYFMDFFHSLQKDRKYGITGVPEDGKAVMVEYSSPNTNKPLHLGHVRNNLLGFSVARILEASGTPVYKTQIINDRGIHICKSMLAWKKYGNGETPDSTQLKGDKLVGNYYVKFEKEFQQEYTAWLSSPDGQKEFQKFRSTPLAEKLLKEQSEITEKGLLKEFRKHFKNDYFNTISDLGAQAQEMLRKWESGDPEIVALWKKMNGWVYDGFEETYKNLGVDFDKLYYESNTYLLGKQVVEMGLEKGVFYKKADGSVWIDLSDEGLDEKIVLRADGTAVYMTQDIGTAIQRVTDYPNVGGLVYTVGNEQDYHFKVLFLILKKLGFSWADNLYHLSYGMVDLPSGKMKSREGTVVDADDLLEEMTRTAETLATELGKLEGYTPEEKQTLYKIIGLGALKYYVLKVDPRKRILFNPEESVDFQGNTGPFLQYTYARIQSILRKTDFDYLSPVSTSYVLHNKERELLKRLQLFPETLQQAAENYSPALIANYVYELVKEFNSFYQNVSILGAEEEESKRFRIQLSDKVGEIIKRSLYLLGIEVPERM